MADFSGDYMKLAMKHFTIVLLVSLCCGCSTLSATDAPIQRYSNDPLEGLNRKVYSYNRTADKFVLRTVAKAYDKVVPKPAKRGVRHFFANLGEPIHALNNLLQGKYDRALDSVFRFAINSTVGMLGVFDVARRYDVHPAKEDFGQTLAAWGLGPGPYLVLPFAGPSNLRDGIGTITDGVIVYPINEVSDSRGTRNTLFVLDVLDLRAGLLGSDELLESQLDSYAFLKQAYEQNRVRAIYDGNPPAQEEEDLDF
ncbi:MAG: VacJ family lipoprotein [Gammaproteobacteria bacterium]|nr:VacJ family lipoprotein [Gammaproteobacteria bacterium]